MKIVSNKMKDLPMRAICFLFSLGLLPLFLNAQAPPVAGSVLGNRAPSPPKRGPVVVHQIQYTGTLAETKASFVAVLSLECTNQVETVLPLFTGDLAVTGRKLPEGLRLDRSGKGYLLTVTKPGEYEVELDILAKITKADPWRKIEFTGPTATIGGVSAAVAGDGLELELLSGTPRPRAKGDNDKSKVSGALGADRKVSLRWQAKVIQEKRDTLLTVQTVSTVQVTPTVIKYTSVYNYDILQGKPTNVVLRFPASQALTSVKSDAPIRDRREAVQGGQKVLTIDFIKPLEKKYRLTLLTEQQRAADQATASLEPPEPQGVQRERGQLNLKALDMKVEPGKPAGLSQINAAADTLGAWQFFGRENFSLPVALQNIDPELSAHDVVRASLEEKSREIVHSLTLTVEKAGIYTVTLTRQAGLMVTDVRGDGITDWKENGNDIEVEFGARVLGQRQVTVVLEEMADALPAQVTIEPLQVTDAKRQTAKIFVMPARGLEIKAAQKTGLREAPAARGQAFTAAAPGWILAVTPRQLPPRVVAQVSNGVVIGDNRVYGFAKIFYAISDQGVDTFHVRVPAAWENVQFLGTRKRRELTKVAHATSASVDNIITLQDLAWDQYTLQVTYDLQLDDNATTTLNLRGAHPMQMQDGELVPLDRDTGTLVVHSVDSIKLGKETTMGLNRTDHAELEEHVRSRINHTIQLAYKYDGTDFSLKLPVSRKDEIDVLNAVADYAELTTVVTGIGQVATTATLSVKKTDKENPKFKLPAGAEFISCRIDGATVKPGQDKKSGEYIIPLPEDASRSQVFRVQISYSETHEKFKHTGMAKLGSGTLNLTGPVTPNIRGTYSRWNVYVPDGHELYGFEGNMVAPKGRAPYTLATAWSRFNRSLRYVNWMAVFWISLVGVGALAVLMVYLRRGRRVALITSGGIVGVLLVGGVITLFSSMGGMAKYEYATTGSDYPATEDSEDEAESSRSSNRRPNRDYAQQNEYKSGGFTTGRDDDTNVPAGRPKTKSPAQPGKPDSSEKPQDSKTRTPTTPARPGGGGGMGGGGIGGGVGDLGGGLGPSGSTSDAGTVTGVLPPEFHIPVDRAPDYIFTKALNLAGKDESLTIMASIMDRQSHRTRTGILQWLVALAGLGLLIQQGLRKERCSYSITGGIALLLGGIGALMVSQGTLHLLFLNALWVLALALLSWATWFFWPAQRYIPPAPKAGDDGSESGGDSTPPADDSSGGSATAATAALLLLLTLNTASAGVPAPNAPAPTWEGLENLLRRLVDPNALPQQPGGPKVIRESQLQDRNGTWFEINQEASYTGQVVGFFQNRQKRIESNYSTGQLHGAQSLWFDNGQKRQMTQFQKGQRHGAQSTWYRNGQRASDTNYQKDRRHGQRRAWHVNGKLAEETTWVAGELHGLARHWHDNGKIAREVRWENGRQLAFDTWTAKGARMGAGTNSVSMVTASYKLNVHREVAQVEAEFQLSARAAKQKFTLFREVIAVDEFTCSQAGAKLLREGPALVLYLPDTGAAVVKMKFLVKHAGDGTKRTLGFGIPSALTSNVDVVLQDDDSDVDMPTAVTFNATSGGNQTLVDAVIGASDRLELTWKPQVQKAKEIKATVFVQTASTVAFGNGVVQSRTVLDYTVAQGELNEVKVQLPAEKTDGDAYAWTLMKVDGGKLMRNYFEKTEDGGRILTVQLDKGVPTGYQLSLELERTLPVPPSGEADPALAVPLSLPVAKPGTVNRETGFIALQSSEELDLSPQTALMKVDAAEFTRRTKQPIAAGAAAYGYTNPSYSLTAGVKTLLPEIEATARHLTAISDEQLRVTTHVAYTIKRVGVFELKLLLPTDEALRVEKVAGPGNPQWEEKTVEGTRQLVVTLKQRTKGLYPLRVELVKPLDALPGTVTAEGAHPVHPLENRELKKLTHHVGVYGEEGVVVKLAPGKSASLTDMSASELSPVAAVSNPPGRQFTAPGIPDNAHALAYQFIDTSPDADRDWNVTVTTEPLKPWVRNAQLVNWVKVGNTRVTGLTRIRYEVERASARRFTVMMPLNINTNHVKFTGANIRGIPELKPTPQGNLYTITLQDKVRPGRDYLLNIDWELTEWEVGDKGTTLAFTGPVTQGKNIRAPLSQADFTAAGMVPLVEGEEGWLVISDDARSHLTMTPPAKPKGWEKKNTGELPKWARDGSGNARLVYYYFRTGHSFDLGVKKLKDADVEPAWISQANFTSVITEDGQMLTRMTLDVNNHGKPTLGITLPGKQAEILSVFVNGQAVRPTQAGEQFEVALENSSEVGNFPVEVVYTSRVKFPRTRNRVTMKSPTFDVKLNNAHWWLYLPRDYTYADFEGTMDYTDAQAMARRVTSLDANHDGRLDQKELGKDSQYGWLLGGEADGRAVDLSKAHKVNPLSGASIGYSFETYQGQQQGNAKKELDNLAKQQAIQELNLDANNLSALNRYNDQSLKTINQLTGKYRGPGNERDNQRLKGLQEKQKELESKRRFAQVQEEQRAQDDFTSRNTYYPSGGGRNPAAANASGQASGQQAANPVRRLADAETVERQGRQIDEINRIQQRVTSGEVTPLNINLPLEGVFLAFSQPLQTVKGEAMEISFEAESTRRTNWWSVAVWSLLGIAALYFLVNAIRLFALRKPQTTEA